MEAAGWIVDVDHINNEIYEKTCKSNPFWAYGYLRDGSISTIFEGSGHGVLVFGNCHDRGAVQADLNRKVIGFAQPNQTEIVAHFDYQPGDKLMIKDKDAAIISIKSLTLSCEGTISTPETTISGNFIGDSFSEIWGGVLDHTTL